VSRAGSREERAATVWGIALICYDEFRYSARLPSRFVYAREACLAGFYTALFSPQNVIAKKNTKYKT